VLNSAASLTISDCFARNFQNSGILLTPYPTLHIFSKVNISILNSVMNNNGTGLTVFGTGSGDTVVTVRKSVANYNVNGFSLSGVLLILADTMATGNTEYGILVAPITGDVTHSGVDSYGDNEINGNLTGDISGGTLSPVAKQ